MLKKEMWFNLSHGQYKTIDDRYAKNSERYVCEY